LLVGITTICLSVYLSVCLGVEFFPQHDDLGGGSDGTTVFMMVVVVGGDVIDVK
jgi:hypothetical protein